MTEEKQGNGAATEEKPPEQFNININTGYHTELNVPLVIVSIGPTTAAMDPNQARQVALQMIGAALVSEQEAVKRHQPIIQQATAAAMQAVKRH